MSDGLLALIGVLVFLAVLFVLLSRSARPKLKKSYYQNQWASINDKKSDTEKLIYADRLLDSAMRKLKVRGQTMGERLNNSEAFIKDINSVWKAHKLRNGLVHESDFNVSEKDVKHALNVYKKALKDLGAL